MERIFVTKTSMPPYEEYIEAIKPLWESHWLTNMGEYHGKFEEELKKYLGVSEFSLTVNGHMALELVLQAFEFPRGSEIITTPFTFISTTHAITRIGHIPVFCDVKESDGTIDEAKIEDLITEKTVAILPVHVYGNICNVEKIQQIAEKYGLKVIYDAAHAFGIKYRGRGIGTYGDASVFSFHATKMFNSIEGGGVASAERSIYEKLYNLKNFGIRNEEYVEAIGANAKMNEFSAIMGLCNLKHIKEAIESRKNIFEEYERRLSGVPGIRIISRGNADNYNYGYFAIIVGKEYPLSRDELFDKMREKDIYARKYFYPLTCDHECYSGIVRGERPVIAEKMANGVLTLPLFEGMSTEQLERVCALIERFL